jgi:hypothetical protein
VKRETRAPAAGCARFPPVRRRRRVARSLALLGDSDGGNDDDVNDDGGADNDKLRDQITGRLGPTEGRAQQPVPSGGHFDAGLPPAWQNMTTRPWQRQRSVPSTLAGGAFASLPAAVVVAGAAVDVVVAVVVVI